MKEEIQYILPYNLVEPFYINIAGISYCDGSYWMQRKCSTETVFEYVTAGRGNLIVNGESYEASAGNIWARSTTPKRATYTCWNTAATKSITATHASLGQRSGSTRQALSSESLCAPTV